MPGTATRNDAWMTAVFFPADCLSYPRCLCRFHWAMYGWRIFGSQRKTPPWPAVFAPFVMLWGRSCMLRCRIGRKLSGLSALLGMVSDYEVFLCLRGLQGWAPVSVRCWPFGCRKPAASSETLACLLGFGMLVTFWTARVAVFPPSEPMAAASPREHSVDG